MDTYLIKTCAVLANEAYEKKLMSLPYSTLIENNEYDTQCHIGVKENVLFIVGRGTSSKTDVLQDVKLLRKKCTFLKNTKIHQGFLEQYESIKNDIETFIDTILTENKDIYNIVFTGHSLGNAIATIGAIDFKLNNKFKDKKVQCITFASPRIGCPKFAKLFNSKIDISHRIVLHRDPVTFVPFCLRFRHVKGCIHLKKDGTTNISDSYFFPLGCWISQHFMDAYVDRVTNQFISSHSSETEDSRL